MNMHSILFSLSFASLFFLFLSTTLAFSFLSLLVQLCSVPYIILLQLSGVDSLVQRDVVLIWGHWTNHVSWVWRRGSRVSLTGRRPVRRRRSGAMLSGWVHIERKRSASPRAERNYYSLPRLSNCEEDFREWTWLVIWSMRLKEPQKWTLHFRLCTVDALE